MTKETIEKYYNENKKLYLRLAKNIQQSLETFLEHEEISFHSISFRIKEFDSYYEKSKRKDYENPLDQIEDFCGIRIICFYPSDLEKISQIIKKEFDILESIDKSANMEPDRFGYRSNHYIVNIKKDWLHAPNYRGLENLKAEVQVRTILMHSWADIEHKLAYKTKDEIPIGFRRKLYQLSALLEIADSQFQELKNDKENFKSSLIVNKNGNKTFKIQEDLKLDSFQAYVDFAFPHRDNTGINDLYRDIKKLGINLEDIEKYRQETFDILPEIESEILRKGNKWSQVGIIRALLDLKSDTFWNERNERWKNTRWGQIINTWRKRINAQ